MSISQISFINSLIFLAGIVLLLAGSFPAVRARYPRLFLNGFAVTLASLGLMLLAAFLWG